MAEILREFGPSDSHIFVLGEDSFLLLSESLRGSAVRMAVITITEAAMNGKDAYTPVIRTADRRKDETARDFADRLLKIA